MEKSIKGFLSAVKKAEKLRTGLIEIRADGLENQAEDNIKKLLKEVRKITEKDTEIIFTLRKKEEGGKFKGSEKERIEIMKSCLDSCGFDLIDIELSAEKKALKEIVKKAGEKNKKIIVSFHDFKKTPSKRKMIEIIKKEIGAGADIAKLAVKTNSKEDVIKLLKVTLSAKKLGKVITIGMGKAGKVSRILTPLLGSEVTYGYLNKPTAEGQISVKSLKLLFEAIGL